MNSQKHRPLVLAALLILALSGAGFAQNRGSQALTRVQRAVTATTKVTSFLLEGGIRASVDARTGQVKPEPAPFKMLVLLPDHYLRIEDETIGMRRKNGFAGNKPLRASTPLKSGVTSSFSQISESYVPDQRAVAARLLLGILGIVDGPLTLNAQPEGASTFKVTGADGFESRLDVEPTTGIPMRVRYEGAVFFYTPPAAGEFQAARRSEKAELTWSFSDRRNVGGVLLPHVITLTAKSLTNGQTYTQQEIRLESAQINGALKEADFTAK
jgi:hypothetical protein